MDKNSRLRILIIEDDVEISAMMHQIIDDMKTFTIDRAYSYNEALEMFEPGKYIAITLDLNLGKSTKDGIDLATKFRGEDSDVFIAVVSGYFNEIFDQDLIDTVDDFISKPFDHVVFKLKIFSYTTKYRRRLNLKRHIEGGDIRVREEVLSVLDKKIKEMYNHAPK